MAISKTQIKLIRSLSNRKTRNEQNIFLAEGDKIVLEALINKKSIKSIFATEEWLLSNEKKLQHIPEITTISEDELGKISFLKKPNKVLALIKKENHYFNIPSIHSQLSLVLDNIQDPGNMGTILRIADWFGIEWLICSENTVDTYNPKVIQASMGAFLRVKCVYLNLPTFFQSIQKTNFEIYGALLEGGSIYNESLESTGIIVMGNESKGINPDLYPFLSKKISIPGFPLGKQGAESLNVGVATGIICAEFRRNSK